MIGHDYRALIEWPTVRCRNAFGSGEYDGCAGCGSPDRDEHVACRVAQRNAALESAALQAERIEAIQNAKMAPLDDYSRGYNIGLLDAQRIARGDA